MAIKMNEELAVLQKMLDRLKRNGAFWHYNELQEAKNDIIMQYWTRKKVTESQV